MLGNGFCFFDVFVCRVFPRRMAAHMFFIYFLDNHFCDAFCCVVGWLFVFCLVSGFPDLFDSRCFFLFFVESLILAQDERWRRA